MKNKHRTRAGNHGVAVVGLLLATAVQAGGDADAGAGAAIDTTPPVIDYQPGNALMEANKPLTLTLRVSDKDSGLAQVNFFFRPYGAAAYEKRPAIADPAQPGSYLVTLSAANMQEPGIEYYIEAIDNAGNIVSRGVSFSPMSMVIFGGTGGVRVADQPTEPPAGDLNISGTPQRRWWWVAAGVAATGAVYASSRKKEKSNSGEVLITSSPPSGQR